MLRSYRYVQCCGPFVTRHQLRSIVPLGSYLSVILSFRDFPVTVCGPCHPSPEHAQPQGFDSMATMTPRAICMCPHPPLCAGTWVSNAACPPFSRSEEGKLSTSQDAACKDVEESPETAEAKSAAPRAPSSSPERR